MAEVLEKEFQIVNRFNDQMKPLVGWWRKPPTDVRVPSRTAQAVAWLESHPNAALRDAARHFDINVSAISRYLKRRETREVCPHCGRAL